MDLYLPNDKIDDYLRFHKLWQQEERGTLKEDDEDELSDLYEELGTDLVQQAAAAVKAQHEKRAR